MTLTACPPSQKLIDFVGALGGTWSGAKAMCRCPAHPDSTPSLSLRQGEHTILVHCFAGCAAEDVLRALGQIVPRRHYAQPTATPPYDAASLVARIWDEGRAVSGTLAERYLSCRSLASSFADLKFHPRCAKGPKPLTVFSPALLVGLRADAGIIAVQRIFLDAEGRRTEKMLLGQPRDAAWRGTPAGEALGLAEGFETAAAFTQLHGIPCWAALGGERFAHLALPSTVRTLIIAEDNGQEGARLAKKAYGLLAQRGHVVRRMPPPERFGDWADVLKSQ